MVVCNVMVKSPPPQYVPGPCGGMAERLKAHVLKTCLGHTNVGSNPTPSAESRLQVYKLEGSNKHEPFAHTMGRCQSGRMGPPAKRLPGRNPRSQVRILSSPPHKNTSVRTCFCSVARPHGEDAIRILRSRPRHMKTRP